MRQEVQDKVLSHLHYHALRIDSAEELPANISRESRDETTGIYTKVVLHAKGTEGKCSSSGQCGFNITKPHSLNTVLDYRTAFYNVNEDAIENDLQTRMTRKLGAFSDTELKDNGKDARDTPIREWFLTSSQLQGKQRTFESRFGPEPSQSKVGSPLHFDGSPSFLHCGITNGGGKRTVKMWAEQPDSDDRGKTLYWKVEPPPVFELHNKPGTIYLGNLCGPAHQVCHADPPRKAKDYAQVKVGEETLLFSATAMLRTTLFRHGAFARLRIRKGDPADVWDAINEVMVNWLRTAELRLPTYAEYVAVRSARQEKS